MVPRRLRPAQALTDCARQPRLSLGSPAEIQERPAIQTSPRARPQKVLIFNWIFQLAKNAYKLVRKKKKKVNTKGEETDEEVKIMSRILFITLNCQR